MPQRLSRLACCWPDYPLWFLLPLVAIPAGLILFFSLGHLALGQLWPWWFLAAALLILSWYRGSWGLYALAGSLPLFGHLPFSTQSHVLVLLTLAFLLGAYGRLLLASPRMARWRTGLLLANRDGGLLLIALWLIASLFGLLGLPLLASMREIGQGSAFAFLTNVLNQPNDHPIASLRGVALNALAILVGLYAYLQMARREGVRFGVNLFTALVAGLVFSIISGLLEYFGWFDLSSFRSNQPANSGRVLAFFVHPSLLAAYLAMLMPVMPILLCRRHIRALPGAAQTSLLLLLLVAGEVCLILSMQGGAWVSYPPTLLLIWVAFYYVLDRRRDPGLSLLGFIRQHWLKVLITLPISISLSVFIVYGLKQYQRDQNQTPYQVIATTTQKAVQVLDESQRERHWLPSLALLAKNPIYGGGGDSYAWQVRHHALDPDGVRYRELAATLPTTALTPESQYLQILVGRGTLGFLFFASLTMLAIYRLLAVELGFLTNDASRADRQIFAAHLVRLCTLGSLLATLIFGLVQEVTLTFNLQLIFWLVLLTGLGATRPPATAERRHHLRHSFTLVLTLMLVLLPFHLANKPYLWRSLNDSLANLHPWLAGLLTLQNGFTLSGWALAIALSTGVIYLFVINHSQRSGFFIDELAAGRVQQAHRHPTPRIGGIGLFTANLFTLFNPLGWKLILCALPAFLAGIMDDYRPLPPKIRLLLQASAGLLAILILQALITRIGFGVTLPYGLALVLTLIAIPGLINAINIIDGFNGLASGVSLMVLVSLAIVAWAMGDLHLAEILVVNMAGLIGFLVLNYPRGRIFLGDGGSYYLGFLIAVLSVLLIVRHDAVSPLYPLAICAYPVFEVLFSIYRRKWVRRTHATAPDHIHLHSLIYRRWTRNNPKTTLWIWCGVLPFVVVGTLCYRHDGLLLGLLVLFVVTYLLVYRRLTRFGWREVFR